MVGACVYIRERGERVEDAQSVNRNARTRTRPAPGHASCSAPSTLQFSSLPLPPPWKKIPSLIIPNKVPRQLRELGSSGAPGRSYPTMNCPILSIPSSPPSSLSLLFLPTSVTQKPYLGLETKPVCLFVCLSTLLTSLSCLVLPCLVLCLPHASSCFNYSASPTTDGSPLPSSLVTVELLGSPTFFVSQFAACSPRQPLVCGWRFRSHAMQFFTTRPPTRLASHCRAAAARELELGLERGAGLGWAARLSCQLIEYSHARRASIHRSVFSPFPHTTCMMESASSAA